MDKLLDNLISRHTFNTQNLVDAHPANLRDANKKIVYQIACPPGCTHNGELVFSRWGAMTVPAFLSDSGSQTEFEERKGYFSYQPSGNTSQVEWYLNFAHSDLFCAYGDPLFAQDEMQVAEHPALGSLREALLSADINLLTVESGEPTPILIRGVERRCEVATDRNAKQGRPFGLYGNDFAEAKPEAIKQATKPLNPPTITNIIAMEAPFGGYGCYTQNGIEYILKTAFTGFSAARIESLGLSASETKVVINTGFWGCGAYGGNRILMALLQLIAARLAGVNRLVFHTGDGMVAHHLATAHQILARDLAPVGSRVEVTDLIAKIHGMEFQWGVSDGN
jgi:Poly (ADP-ribose) glycohydrolase (PARG)